MGISSSTGGGTGNYRPQREFDQSERMAKDGLLHVQGADGESARLVQNGLSSPPTRRRKEKIAAAPVEIRYAGQPKRR